MITRTKRKKITGSETTEDTEIAEINVRRSKQLEEEAIPVIFGLSATEAVRED